MIALTLSSFQLSDVKPKPKKSLWPITNNTLSNSMDQSRLKLTQIVEKCVWYQVKIGFGWESCASFFTFVSREFVEWDVTRSFSSNIRLQRLRFNRCFTIVFTISIYEQCSIRRFLKKKTVHLLIFVLQSIIVYGWSVITW